MRTYRPRPTFIAPPGVPWAARMRKPPRTVPLITYDCPLRPNLVIRMTLPMELTREDAVRIQRFVRSLAFPDQPEASDD